MQSDRSLETDWGPLVQLKIHLWRPYYVCASTFDNQPPIIWWLRVEQVAPVDFRPYLISGTENRKLL